MKLPNIFSRTLKHKCPDGSIRITYKRIDEAFPLFIPGFRSSGEGNVELLKKAKVKLKAEYESKIQGLLYNLDDINHSSMIMFRGAYAVFHANPCGSIDFFQREVEKINHKQNQMTELRMQINGLITLATDNNNNPKEIMRVYLEILNKMGIPNGTIAANEIKENREAAKKWIGGYHG